MVDGGFDKGCEEIATGGGLLARVQSGRVQMYLRLLALAVVVLAAILIWSGRHERNDERNSVAHDYYGAAGCRCGDCALRRASMRAAWRR